MAVDSTQVAISAPSYRFEEPDYLKVKGTYYLMGTGFTQLDETHGAQETTKTYINDKTSTSFIKGYQREFPYNYDYIREQVAVNALRQVGRKCLTGTDAMFEYVRVDLKEPKSSDASNTAYYARHFIVSAIPDSDTGEGASEIIGSGTLKAVGDMTVGWFDISTKEFTEDENADVEDVTETATEDSTEDETTEET